jgi:hypothetical protein
MASENPKPIRSCVVLERTRKRADRGGYIHQCSRSPSFATLKGANCRSTQNFVMTKPLLTLFVALSSGISAFANPTPPAEIDNLIHDKAFVALEIQQYLDDIYKGGNTQLVDTSLFSAYSSGNHHYLIAKAYITFYNLNPRQEIRGILKDVDSGWTFSITEAQLDYFVRTGDRTHLPQPPNLDPNEALQTPSTDPGPTADPSPNRKIVVWSDGRVLIHPEHSVRVYVINVKSDDTLMLRSGPGTRFRPVKVIPRDRTDLIAFDQDRVWDGDTWWYPVEWQGFRGYVGRSHLSTIN